MAANEGDYILHMKNIDMFFPGVKALKNVEFNLKRGEIHSLMGENGAGKSTLIKVLTGVYHKTNGQIEFNGNLIEPKTPLESQQLGISTVYQEVNLCANLTVAENIYIGRWLAENKPENVWPFNIVDSHVPLTEESIRNAYTNNQYGRCVFACDNNVVDNQFVNMVFENGVKANLTMTAFTNWLGRKMVLHGTAGEIELNENQRTIRVAVFGKEEEFIDLDRLVENDFFQHGGGDNNILNELYAMMENSADKANSLEDSAESHFMAIAAEKSRKSHTVVAVHDDE